jgi:Homing endonuclease associated repeat/Sigma-70, region 4
VLSVAIRKLMASQHAPHTARVQEMYALYQDGATLEEVGKRYEITRERVRQLFNKAGLATRSRKEASERKRDTVTRRIEEHRKQIVQGFLDTRNLDAAAAEHDLPVSAVKAILKEALPSHEYRALTYKPWPKQYTNDELISFLRQAGAAQDGILSLASYRRFAGTRRKGRKWPTPQTYSTRFGSCVKALHAAGMQANVPHTWGGKRFDVDECLAAVRAVAQELGKPPTRQEYEQCARDSEGSLPSVTTVGKRCGGWVQAVYRAAG